MNKWVEKSINISKSNFYLDNLLEIYPPDEIDRGLFINDKVSNLRKFFQEKQRKELLRELILLKRRGFKFPLENSYISFLSHYNGAIDKNPKIVKIITDEIFKNKLQAPKKASRRIGPMFRKWLERKFKFVDHDPFKKNKGLIFLKGDDKQLREYAEKELSCDLGELSKGLDFLAKIKNIHLIGTAKFITDFGGSQGNQFYEAIRFIKETKCPENVIKIAVMDGVAWLESTSKKGRKMQNILINLENDKFCLSALLLKYFIKEENKKLNK